MIVASPHLPLLRVALAAHPNTAVAAATVGCALILWEFHRPGSILPAAFGLLLCLFAAAAVLTLGVQPWAVGLLLLGGAGLLLNTWRPVPVVVLALNVAMIIAGLRYLLPSAAPVAIRTAVALLCGGLLGTASAVLTRFAYRARRAKALD